VDQLIKAGVAVNHVTANGLTPLSWASENGHECVVELLIKAGAAVDQADAKGRTPLFMASVNENIAVVEQLIKAGAAVNKADVNKYTPLLWASFYGHTSVVDMLIKADAAVDQVYRPKPGRDFMFINGFTPLCLAIRSGVRCFEVVKLLLKAGDDFNHVTAKGLTPLYLASKNGHAGVVEHLLKAGAVDKADAKGRTPLYLASKNGHAGVVKLLLKACADFNH
jgi:ankyrin repeat protein